MAEKTKKSVEPVVESAPKKARAAKKPATPVVGLVVASPIVAAPVATAPVAAAPVAIAPAKPVPSDDAIARRAHEIHLERGGNAFDNWLEAERELKGQ